MCIDSEQLITSSVFCFFSFFFTTIISDEILQLHLLILQLEMFVFLPLELLVEISLLGGKKNRGCCGFSFKKSPKQTDPLSILAVDLFSRREFPDC
jgi:hypothetical protein